MKKFIIAIMVLALATTALSACGKNETVDSTIEDEKNIEVASEKKATKTTEKSTAVAEIVSVENFMTWIEEKIDVSMYKTPESTETSVGYYAENEKELDLDCIISLSDGTSINMPMAVEKLVEQGWNPHKDSDMDVELKSGYSTSTLFKKDGIQLTVYSANLSDQTATYGDGQINRVLFDLYSSEDNYGTPSSSGPDFEICGGINTTSNIDDVISILGMPEEISYSIIGDNSYAYICVNYYGSSAYDNLEITFNADGSKIVNIDYSCDVR